VHHPILGGGCRVGLFNSAGQSDHVNAAWPLAHLRAEPRFSGLRLATCGGTGHPQFRDPMTSSVSVGVVDAQSRAVLRVPRHVGPRPRRQAQRPLFRRDGGVAQSGNRIDRAAPDTTVGPRRLAGACATNRRCRSSCRQRRWAGHAAGSDSSRPTRCTSSLPRNGLGR
jgi:hypothetical protein